MFLNNMATKKKILASSVILVALTVGIVAVQANIVSAAMAKTQQVKAIGKAKFVLQGTVTAVSANTVTLHVVNTSVNAKQFDNKDKTFTVTAKTVVTKSGKNIALNQIKPGAKVKVFGIFDKKTGTVTVVRWIKVITK